jgi:hypothetical protein
MWSDSIFVVDLSLVEIHVPVGGPFRMDQSGVLRVVRDAKCHNHVPLSEARAVTPQRYFSLVPSLT